MRSSNWCPVESVLRSEVWFSIVPFDVAESFFSQAWGQALADALSTPQAKTSEFSSSGNNPSIGECCFHCPFREWQE